MLLQVLLLFSFARLVISDDNNNYWLYPPSSYPNQHFGPTDPVWLLGSNVTLRWITNMDTYNITLWQQNPNEARAGPVTWASIYTKNAQDPEIGVQGYNWTVQTYGLDATDAIPVGSPVFFLAGGQVLTVPGSPGFVSYYVNFTNNPGDPGLQPSSSTTVVLGSTTTSSGMLSTTATPSATSGILSSTNSSSPSTSATSSTALVSSSSSSSSSSSTIATSTASTATATQSLAAQPIATSTPDSVLSSGSKAAIGVACGFGIPVVAILMWLAFRREFRSRDGSTRPDARPPAYSESQDGDCVALKEVLRTPFVEAYSEPTRYEMGEGVRLELAG